MLRFINYYPLRTGGSEPLAECTAQCSQAGVDEGEHQQHHDAEERQQRPGSAFTDSTSATGGPDDNAQGQHRYRDRAEEAGEGPDLRPRG
jgi:hypothetical protein